MLALTPMQHLTSADLKGNLQDIQDNVVAPILMRYGRHIFVKFTRRREGARMAAQHVQVRQRAGASAWDMFHRQYRIHLPRPEGARAVPAVAQTASPRRSGSACGVVRLVGDVGPNAPEQWEGGLGGPDIHAMGLVRTDSERGT